MKNPWLVGGENFLPLRYKLFKFAPHKLESWSFCGSHSQDWKKLLRSMVSPLAGGEEVRSSSMESVIVRAVGHHLLVLTRPAGEAVVMDFDPVFPR